MTRCWVRDHSGRLAGQRKAQGHGNQRQAEFHHFGSELHLSKMLAELRCPVRAVVGTGPDPRVVRQSDRALRRDIVTLRSPPLYEWRDPDGAPPRLIGKHFVRWRCWNRIGSDRDGVPSFRRWLRQIESLAPLASGAPHLPPP